ncbi:MAG: F0F1 ATP synthase subunit A [Anaerolineaceae bacterium]|mgnify:FL=1|nr:F0F1 ATP synthase subunit A [Anaerolineaceae bacterium]
MEKTRKWRWGKNRWIVLALLILTIIAVNIYAPIQPHIQAAAENLSSEPLFTLPGIGDFYLTNTLVATILMDVVIIVIALIVRHTAKKDELAPKGLAGVFEMLVEMLYNMTESTAGKWAKKIFPWFATVLILVLFANLLKLIPGFETIGLLHHSAEGYEAQSLGGNWYTILNTKAEEGGYMVTPFLRGVSTDINFTLALAIIAVTMTQVIGFQANGFRYLEKFFNFRTIFKKPVFGLIDVFVGLLELISEFSKILSFTFRLFGNMFAGMVLMALVAAMLPVFMPAGIMLFELFIGVIQAYVFGMLTMVFMAQATQGHSAEEEHSNA